MTARVLYNTTILGQPPVPAPLPALTLLDSAGAAFNATALPASGAWRQSEMLNVTRLRRVTIRLAYNASSATTTGYALVQFLCCGIPLDPLTGAEPLIGDDVWYSPMITDGVVTATATAGTLPTGADWSNGPLFGQQIHRPFVMQPPAAVANSNKLRMKLTLDVTDEFFLYVIASEVGDATNRGTLSLIVNGSA